MTRARSPIEDLRRYAEFLTGTVTRNEARRAVAQALRRVPVHRVRWQHRVATVAATLILFAAFNVGLAIATGGAVPGDDFYFLKRAYERVGPVIGFEIDTRVERLEEAVVLAHRGQVPTSISLTEEALRDFEDAEAFREVFRALRDAHDEARLLEGTVGSVMSSEFRTGAQSLVTIAGSVVQAQREGLDPTEYAEHLYLTATSVADQAEELRRLAMEAAEPQETSEDATE